jgi:penicillin-binding protein 1A
VSKTNKKTKEGGSNKKSIKAFWILFTSGVGFMYLLFLGIATFEMLGDLPTFEELENPKSHLATEIFSSDAHLLGTIFKENRSICEQDELSQHLIDALVATEDERYFEHNGIDGKSLLRAVVKLGSAGGGSTITQQLAKMLFTGTRSQSKIERIGQKFNEWVIAVQLERQYTKKEIITMYYNKLDFVNQGVGIKSAANVYFSTTPDKLTIEQSAMFAGMAKNPSLFNPMRKKRRDTTLHRRNVAMFQMVKNGYITRHQYDSLKLIPLNLKPNKATHREGVATYFREEVRGQLRKIIGKLEKPGGGKYDIYRDGLKIYTSINYEMQMYAEKAVKSHLGGELQPTFFKHWRRKSKTSRATEPFYFEGMTAKQKQEMVENLIQKGIRTSSRYKNELAKLPELQKRTFKRNRLFTKLNRLKNKRDHFDEERFKMQQELNRLNKDTINSAYVLREKRAVRKSLKLAQDSLNKYKKRVKRDNEPYKIAHKAYYKLWKPFDDIMQVAFKEPVEMKIFTWKGSVDTTLSPRDSVIHHKWYLRTGMLSVDPKTGYIKAWVGGIDYKHFQYDQVRGTRQVGSTFKPFVYACAIENGVSPCETVLNAPVTFPEGMYGLEESWTPHNATKDNLDGVNVSLKMALANSINSISAKIMKDFGPLAVIDVARRCGITSRIEAVPSICLGTPDVSLFEMVSAYSVFANKGIWIEPSFILRIEDRNGATIWTPTPKRKEAMTEENAYKMLELLGGVAAYGPKVKGKATYGTGVRLRNSRLPYGGIPSSIKIAGKTGTTQMQSDGWFMGITPDLVTGVWVGCEDRAAHFTSLRLGMGTNTALPIWGYYMNSIYKNKDLKVSKGWFELPSGLKKEDLDCSNNNERGPFNPDQ